MGTSAVEVNATEVKYEVFRASVIETERVSDIYRTEGQAAEWLDQEMYEPNGKVLRRNEKPVTGKIEQIVVVLNPEEFGKRNFRLAAKEAHIGAVLKSVPYTQVEIPSLEEGIFLPKARPVGSPIHKAHLRRQARLEEIKRRKAQEDEDNKILAGG